MAEFESWKQYGKFSHFVKRKARHILNARNQQFLDTVVETSAKRKGFIEKGAVLWRAQPGNAWRTERVLDKNGQEIDSFEVEDPYPPERMMPLADRATEGRVNPKGIPCVYFSTNRKTAMAETRPWIGSCVSIAQCVVLKDLTVVDCSEQEKLEWWKLDWHFGFTEPTPEEREGCVWGDINQAFSQPVARTDDVADYAPTQVLAEAFRSAGYDGIAYGSKLGPGKTVAVFDLTATKVVNCNVFRVEAVSLKFSTAGNPYYMEEDSETERQKETGDPGGGGDNQEPPKTTPL
jgi:RES domain-containing protein